jgi:phosphoribosylanthranilate isomerase
MKPCIKICGLTRPEDARLAVELGATHVGCVLVAGSPRSVTSEEAKRVFDAAGGDVQHVLVFKNEKPAVVAERARDVGTSHVQLYSFSEEACLQLEDENLTVYRVHNLPPDARSMPPLYPVPREDRPALLDVGGGGSGRTFSWEILGNRAPHATFIAGGVRPENVGSLLKRRPYGIDLSSGVEARPGIKDPARLRLFFETLENSL